MDLQKKFESLKANVIVYLDTLSRKSWVVKALAAIIIWSVVLVPSYVYFLFKWILEPCGFWENITLLIAWGILLGWLQIGCVIIGFLATLHALDEKI